MSNYIQTDVIDAIDKNGKLVAELDGSDVLKAAREFAHAWEGGLIERINSGEGPTMTKDELKVISSHAWKSQDGVRFRRRYMDGTKPAYPEGELFSGVKRTNLASRVEDAVNRLSHKAWTRGMERIRQETKKLDAELAVTDAKRYAEGLAEVQALDSKNQLKAAILAMSDPVARAQMRAKYAELFDHDALSQMAQERSHAKYDGK